MSLKTRRFSARWLEDPAVVTAYLAGTVWFTYPLARGLRDHVTDLADPLLNAWALAWDIHQMFRDPLRLFDANIFYPAHGALAFSEHLLGIALLVAPVQWVWAQAVLTHNVALWVSIALSGYGVFRLVRWLSGSSLAGLVGGSVFAFAPYRLGHLSHVQLQATGFIPLVFLCLSRYLEKGRVPHALGIAGFVWLTSASCGYYGVFTWIVLGPVAAVEIFRCGAHRHPRRLAGLGAALVLSAVAYLPLARPYMRLERELGFHRPLERVAPGAAHPSSYLRSGTPLHRRLGLAPARAEQMLFPGITALILGAAGLFTSPARARVYVLVGLFSAWASLGPSAGLYAWLYRLVPGVAGLRVPARFSIYVLFALAVSSGCAARAILARLSPRKARVAALLLAVAPLGESVGRPLHFRAAPVEPPQVYQWLCSRPRPSPIVELPMPRSRQHLHENALYMLWSTAHFQPLANGYSAVVPPSYFELAEAMRTVSSPSTDALLRRHGIRYIILHRDLLLRHKAQQMEQALDGSPHLKKVARTMYESIYEVSSESR